VPGAIFSTSRITLKCTDSNISSLRNQQPIRLECAIAPVGPRGEYEIRLLQPLDHDPIFHRSLITTGPGLHHIALRVMDLDRAAQRLAANSSLLTELRSDEGYRCLYYGCEELGGIIELNDRPVNPQTLQPMANTDRTLASYFTRSHTW
jgi:hypothetical protein